MDAQLTEKYTILKYGTRRNRRCRFTDCCIEVWLTFGGIGKYSESNHGEYGNYESDEWGDSEEIIAEKVGVEHLLPAVIKVASHKEEDGYHFDPETTIGIIFGELTAPYDSDRIRAIEELFKDTGIHFRATEYAREEMWSKFRLNVCNNLPQAILGAGVGCYRDSVHMKAISDGLKGELEAIAQAKGIDLSKTEASSGRGSAVPPSARYSTLQDLDAGRHTEIDMFSGALIRMGKELGIPTPYNEYTYHMIKALEEKNDGRFNYTGGEEPTWSK